MKRKIIISLLCVLAVVGVLFAVPALAAGENEASTTVTTAEELISAVGGGYAYVKLGADLTVELSGQELVVDLAGYDLNVSGKGKVKAFDSANDTFDHTECGTLTYSGVTCAATFTAPEAAGGNYYIALGGDGKYTFHRMDMKITSVVFRPSAAGVYYKAYFACDRLVEESILTYGVAARADGVVPGKDFRNYDRTYTELTGLISGTTVNSGLIQNILLGDDASANKENADKAINARLYIELEGQGIVMAPRYSTTSLNSLMSQLETNYTKLPVPDQNILKGFYKQWSGKVAGWNFTNISAADLDFDAINAPLNFDEGTTNAMCYRCGKKVTWTAVSDKSNMSGANGGHYYLAGDIKYEGSTDAFISTGSGTSCLHLNDHDITTTSTKYVFWIGSGKMYVMGHGTVTGKSTNKETGAAIHGNNKNASNGIYLYGGTYTKSADSSSSAPVIGMGGSGRNINIFEQATVDAGTGIALYIDGSSSSREKEGYLGLFGCTINGSVKLQNFGTFANNISVVDAEINGTLNVPTGHRVYLQGSPKIADLSVASDATVILKGLEEGTDICVSSPGYFTTVSSDLASYVSYFDGVDETQGVFLRNNKLFCGKDYVSDLDVTVTQKTETVKETIKETVTDPDTGEQTEVDKEIETTVTVDVHTAYCPVCEKPVEWTPIDQTFVDEKVSKTANTGYSLSAHSHVYLTENITWNSANKYTLFGAPGTAGQICCFHFNGYNITASATTVFYSGSGVLNVMGNGTAMGTAHGGYGATVHSHNINLNSSMNFYAGTYTSTDGNGDVIKAGTNGGRVYFYDDAVVDQKGSGAAIQLSALSGRPSVLQLTGATINGDININGVSAENKYSGTYTMTLDGAKISGTVTAKGTNAITLLNNVRIGLLDVPEGCPVSLNDGTAEGEALGADAFITVKNAGAVAYECDEAENLTSCFRAAWRDDKIVVRDGVLTYKPNYEMGMQYNSEGKARCPVCQDYVTWTAVTEETASVKFTDGGHYYLSKDLTFDVDSDKGAYLISGNAGTTTCLHLNGHTITSKQEAAIAVSGGVINVMGEGTVLGASTNTNGGSAVLANNATATNGANLYSGIYKKFNASSDKPVISIKENGGNITVYEDAVINAEGGTAIYTGAGAEGSSLLTLDNVVIEGNVAIAGATEQSIVNTNHTTVNGTVSVSGTNTVTFSGKTAIGVLNIEEGKLVNIDNLLPGSNIAVSATGAFTEALETPRVLVNYFTAANASTEWVVARDGALECRAREELGAANADEITALDNSYLGYTAKYGEMHNHTSAGLTADGRNSLAEWKDRMKQLGMHFATIVDHKQVAHMYHKDWQTEPTEEYDVVFVGGSEPGTGIQELSENATQGNMHYNMLTGDPQKLVKLVMDMEKTTGKNFYTEGKPYDEANWGVNNNGKDNKYKQYRPEEYNEPDGLLDRIYYPDWTKSEFATMVEKFYDAGGLIVEVHPDYPSYIKSTDPMDYCFSEDAGSAENAAMGFEISTANYGYTPSRTYNEQAYQLWLDMLEGGKKVYATYGDDTHKLPTAMSMTTIYAPEGANAAYYMQMMHDGNFAPGWVGIRMMIGDTQMGGTADSFEGQRLVFSIGDMYEANDYSRMYRDKKNEDQILTWEPGYDASCTYTVRLYDDSGLLQESEVNPSEMNYYAFDAEPDAKFYRVEVWVEKLNEDGTTAHRYRCGVSQPIWNTAAYATAE